MVSDHEAADEEDGRSPQGDDGLHRVEGAQQDDPGLDHEPRELEAVGEDLWHLRLEQEREDQVAVEHPGDDAEQDVVEMQ